MVNRVWQHLFGQGLVTQRGQLRRHRRHAVAPGVARSPGRAVRARRLVGQEAGADAGAEPGLPARRRSAPADACAVDPANRLVWRHSPRRLEAEEIRDAMLAAAGNAGPRPARRLAGEGTEGRWRCATTAPRRSGWPRQAQASTHRSVYLPLLRGLTPRSLEVFDFAEQGMVTGSRDATTVATQALYLLNDPFVRRQSLALAERLLRHERRDDAGRIDLAYRLTLGRPATPRRRSSARDGATSRDYEAGRRREPADVRTEPRSWASFCQAPARRPAEFRYLR